MLVVAHHRVGVCCFGLEKNFCVVLVSSVSEKRQETVAFLLSLKKKRNHINIIEVKSKSCDGIDEIQFVRKKKTLI